jgi:hypothetical protein
VPDRVIAGCLNIEAIVVHERTAISGAQEHKRCGKDRLDGHTQSCLIAVPAAHTYNDIDDYDRANSQHERHSIPLPHDSITVVGPKLSTPKSVYLFALQ